MLLTHGLEPFALTRCKARLDCTEIQITRFGQVEEPPELRRWSDQALRLQIELPHGKSSRVEGQAQPFLTGPQGLFDLHGLTHVLNGSDIAQRPHLAVMLP